MLLVLGVSLTGVVLLPAWAALILVPIAAGAATTATMLGHEGGHRSFSARPAMNQLFLNITLPLLSGMSALHWKHKHNQLHHGHPNVLDRDPDIELWPMAMSRRDYERAGPFHRWFQRNLQSYFFWPMSVIIPTSMRMPNVPFLVRYARTRGIDGAWVADVACLLAHHVLWLVIPAFVFGVLPVVALYLSLWGVSGILLGMAFAPAHIGIPLVAEQRTDWVHNLETTSNLLMPRWLSWLVVGLDHQVEHHIFPGIPHGNMRKAGPIVSRWCAENGLPYRQEPFITALWRVTTFMRHAWRTEVGQSAVAEQATSSIPRGASFSESARTSIVPG
jgi:fatty acid desaturase